MNIQEIAQRHNFEIEEIEEKDHGTIVRGVDVRKLQAMREEMLAQGHPRPISCHREEESSEAFMILWRY